jgi:tyrosine-protein kinase
LRLQSLAQQAPPNANLTLNNFDIQPEISGLSTTTRAAVDAAASRVLGVDSVAGQIEVVQPATAPTSPSSPDRPLLIVLAVLVGLTIAVVIALMLEIHSRRGLDEDAVADIADARFVGSLEVSHSQDPARAVPVESRPQSFSAEQYRVLAARLRLFEPEERPRSLVVLDANDGATAGIVAMNLAAALSGSEQRVLLVDANTWDEGEHSLFGLDGRSGYSDAMRNPSTLLNGHLRKLVIPRNKDLIVLPRGTRGSTVPISSDRIDQALSGMETAADLVIVAGPPLLRSTAALMWAQGADGTLVVLDATTMSRADALSAVRDLNLVEARMLGIALARSAPEPAAHEELARRLLQRSRWTREQTGSAVASGLRSIRERL